MAKQTLYRCVKMNLPNGKVIDILDSVFSEIDKWLQVDSDQPESGGYIIGYKHRETGNITLEKVSHPYPLDIRNRIRFDMRDPLHKIFLVKNRVHKSYYMGVWHTHPQLVPVPSQIDLRDWNQTLDVDKTASEYIFYIIAGLQKIRIWVGDFKSREIVEIFECKKIDGLYNKHSKTHMVMKREDECE